MLKINDSRLLEEHCKKYNISNYFSDWTRVEKSLVMYEKGELICSPGIELKNLIFLVKGKMKIYYLGESGEEFFLSFITDFVFLGDVEYVLKTSTESLAEAVTDVECILIPLNKNLSVLDQDIKFQKFINKSLADKFIQFSFGTFNKELYSLEIRLASYILFKLVNHDELKNINIISKQLRCSYRQLLRVIARFCEIGCLQKGLKKGMYIITNRELLKEIAEKIN